MKLLLVTDIFGAQPEVLLQFDQGVADYSYIQPYDHQPPKFIDDKDAYSYFLAHGGLENYSRKVGQLLKSQTKAVFLVGFSAGAAACWANLHTKDLKIKGCIGFYAGQIRQMTQLQPLYPTELIFAQETHFSVSALMDVLANRSNLKQSYVPYPHGFMNCVSTGYNAEAAQLYWQKIKAGSVSSL